MKSQNMLLPLDEKLEKISTEKLIVLLENESGIVRSRVLATLAYRLEEEKELKEVFFNAVIMPINQNLIFFGSIKVSWIAGIAILEHGDYEDRKILQISINNNWSLIERALFQGYLKDFQELSIAENGDLRIDD